MTVIGELEILLESKEKYVKLQEFKVVTNIIKNILSMGILLKDEDDVEANLGIVNVKYKGTIMKFRRSTKDGLYYLRASQIQRKPGMTEIIYEVNDDKKLKDPEE